jgi:putative tricarboxylic transport membrane protein
VVSGVYALETSLFHVGLALGFGVLGYVMRQLKVPLLPLVLGVVLGFLVESNYRRALVLSGGDHLTFVQDRVAAALLTLAAVFLVGSLVRHARDARARAARARATA